jgi:hypothetical protein
MCAQSSGGSVKSVIFAKEKKKSKHSTAIDLRRDWNPTTSQKVSPFLFFSFFSVRMKNIFESLIVMSSLTLVARASSGDIDPITWSPTPTIERVDNMDRVANVPDGLLAVYALSFHACPVNSV